MAKRPTKGIAAAAASDSKVHPLFPNGGWDPLMDDDRRDQSYVRKVKPQNENQRRLMEAIADHNCMLELVAADWAAAIRVSRVPGGTGSGRKPRTERWSSRVAMVSFHGPTDGMAAP